MADRSAVPWQVVMTQPELSSFHRGKPLAVLGVRHRGLAKRILLETQTAVALAKSLDQNKAKKPRQLTAKRDSGKMPKQRAGARKGR